jgi:phage terminase large subunit-like protein
MATNDIKQIDLKRYYFHQKAADYAVRFFSHLRHFKGEWAGKAFVLQDWQAYIVRQLFGWKHKSDGLRMYRKAHIEAPNRNRKSTMVASLVAKQVTSNLRSSKPR